MNMHACQHDTPAVCVTARAARPQSLHDPLLVLNIESEVVGGASASAARVAKFLRSGPTAELPLDLGVLMALVSS